MRKRFFILAGVGFLLGMLTGSLIAWLTAGTLVNDRLAAWTGSDPAAVILQTLISGLLGSVAMGGTVVYEIEHWPLTACSVTHYLMTEVSYVVIALLLGWVDSLQGLLIMLAIQLVVYVIIWLIMYRRYQAQVRELNQLLEKSKTK
jgi:hypothetical protein